MSILLHRDPNALTGTAEAVSGYTGSAVQLISTTLITAGTRIIAIQAANLSNNATSVYVSDYNAPSAGMHSSVAIVALGLPASDVNSFEFPVPYVVNSGAVIFSTNSYIATIIHYEK